MDSWSTREITFHHEEIKFNSITLNEQADSSSITGILGVRHACSGRKKQHPKDVLASYTICYT